MSHSFRALPYVVGGLVIANLFMANRDKSHKILELEARVAQFPSEVSEMKVQDMDGNFFTTEYMALVRAGPNTDHNKWVYLKEFDPLASKNTTMPAITNSATYSVNATTEKYNPSNAQWEVESPLEQNVEAGN